MDDMKYSNRELKLTAAVYVTDLYMVEYIREHGSLPDEIDTGGMHIGMRLLIERRGTDIELSEEEKLVYDAILSSGRLSGSVVNLVNQNNQD